MKKKLVLIGSLAFAIAFSSMQYAAEKGYMEKTTHKFGNFTVNWKCSDPEFDPAVKNKMLETFSLVYPQLVSRFNKKAYKTVNLFVRADQSSDDPAGAIWNNIDFSSAYLTENKEDTDCLVHELGHIVQDYSDYDQPSWVIEGICDYIRYKYGLNNSNAGWNISEETGSYKEIYKTSARFLLWLERHIRPTIVDEIDSRMRGKDWSSVWKDLTGKSFDKLWSDYNKNLSINEDTVQGGNKALSKTVTASSSLLGCDPSMAVEGSIDNKKWSSNNIGDKWLQVDLGEDCVINKWVVKHAGAGGESPQYNTKDFELQISSDNQNWKTVDTVSNNISNTTSRNLKDLKARYVKLNIIQSEKDSNDTARIYEFEVYGSKTSEAYNIAQNKVVSSSSTTKKSELLYAVDGTTAYKSKLTISNSGDKWIKLDLKKNFNISQWVVRHAGNGGESIDLNTKAFKLQKSSDGVNWVDVDEVTENNSNVTDRSVEEFSSRYLRLYITQSEQTSNNAATIYEFEVYGK